MIFGERLRRGAVGAEAFFEGLKRLLAAARPQQQAA